MFSYCKTLLLPVLFAAAAASPLRAQDPFSTATSIVSINTVDPTPASPPSGPSSLGTPPPSAMPNADPDDPAFARNFLLGFGIEFPESATAVYVPASGSLVVHNTTANLQKIDQLFQNGFKPAEETEGVRIMRAKLAMVLPSVNFGNATVAQAIDYLRRESTRVGSTAGARERVPINLRSLPQAAESAKGTGIPRINLHARNITLDRALRVVAVQAGLDYRVESNSVVLEPESFVDKSMVTKTYSFQFNRP